MPRGISGATIDRTIIKPWKETWDNVDWKSKMDGRHFLPAFAN